MRVQRAKYRKNADYRRRCRAKGLCTHCGRPCAPYVTCEDRRAYQNKQRRRVRESQGYKRGPYVVHSTARKDVRGPLRRWTKVEDDTLLYLLTEGGVSVEEMVRYFKRTDAAILKRAARLGVRALGKKANYGDGRRYVLAGA